MKKNNKHINESFSSTQTAPGGQVEPLVRRLQRTRKKGYKRPENSVYVGRPTKWGNPLRIIGDVIYIDAGYRRKILDKWVVLEESDDPILMLKFYEGILFGEQFNNCDLQYWSNKFKKNNLEDLRGKNLVCWCKTGEHCHADILLKVVNV